MIAPNVGPFEVVTAVLLLLGTLLAFYLHYYKGSSDD